MNYTWRKALLRQMDALALLLELFSVHQVEEDQHSRLYYEKPGRRMLSLRRSKFKHMCCTVLHSVL